jgi:hypothetical protein
MRIILFTALAAVIAACAGQAARQPVDLLDDRTGMTVSVLPRPIEFVERGLIQSGKRASFAYLGPIEWDSMGDIVDGLWLHVAPGTDQQVGDIRASRAVTLVLDDGPLVLAPIDPPKLGREPYAPLVSWGQTAYFGLSKEALARVAASSRVVLQFRGAGDADVQFEAGANVHATFLDYMKSRGISAD